MAERYYLDSNTVIAIIERNTPPTEAQTAFLRAAEDGEIAALSSDLTLSECLVRPIRDGNKSLIEAILAFLDGGDALPLAPLGRTIMIRSAELRAAFGMKLPDAVHVACAREAGCTVMLSADKAMRLPPGMRRISWDDLGKEPA
ncbi:MAG: PIN domain-containing protein [Phyllobacteriaceae bacterium]|nr:PIN domain-containing protein [Phyllobacteriaceae bacterium]